MPKWGTQDYKNAVFQQLAQGSGSGSGGDEDHFQHFENFSAGAPRRDVEAGVREAFHPERLSPDQVQPQLLHAAQKMHPNERAEIAEDLMGELQQRGLAPSWLQKMLGLGSPDPRQAGPDDVARLAEYSRQNHPEIRHGRRLALSAVGARYDDALDIDRGRGRQYVRSQDPIGLR